MKFASNANVGISLNVTSEKKCDVWSAWLVDELVELGHDVTLFASGDSRTRGGRARCALGERVSMPILRAP
jgi:hypothetical protein